MEEIETPIEKVSEQIHESAEHSRERWTGKVALHSAIVAVFAAIAALMAGHHSNEAMISQIQASDQWSFYQAKGVKSSVLNSKMQLLKEMGKTVAPKDEEKIQEYQKQQEEISHKAKEKEEESEHHLRIHEILARSVTLFQVCIAIAAISILTRRQHFWYVSIAFSLLALFFFCQGFLIS